MPDEDKIEHDDVTCKPRIAPPYSQGNELVSGQNAGQQLIVAMSLTVPFDFYQQSRNHFCK